MKVRTLVNMRIGGKHVEKDEVLDVPDQTGHLLVGLGRAERAESSRPKRETTTRRKTETTEAAAPSKE